jgi:acyl transferase domain-containing protein
LPQESSHWPTPSDWYASAAGDYEAGLRRGQHDGGEAFDRAPLTEVCAEAGVEISNVNAPGQLSSAGRWTDCNGRRTRKGRGARRLIPLNVSGAFHSTLMNPIIEEFTRVLMWL